MLVNIFGDTTPDLSQTKPLLSFEARVVRDQTSLVADLCILHINPSSHISRQQYIVYHDSLRTQFKDAADACSISEWNDAKIEQVKKRYQARIQNMLRKWTHEECVGEQDAIISRFRRQLESERKTIQSSEGKTIQSSIDLKSVNDFANRWSHNDYDQAAIPICLLNLKRRHDRRSLMQQLLKPFLQNKQQLSFLDEIDEAIIDMPQLRSKNQMPACLNRSKLTNGDIATWMSHIRLWKLIAAGSHAMVGGEDRWIIGPTFDRDFQMCIRLANQFALNEPICIWLGYHFPLETRVIASSSTAPRSFTLISLFPAQQEMGGAFAFIMNSLFAKHLLLRLESAAKESVHLHVDEWMMRQLPERQLTMHHPIVFTDYFNHEETANAALKLSPFNKICSFNPESL